MKVELGLSTLSRLAQQYLLTCGTKTRHSTVITHLRQDIDGKITTTYVAQFSMVSGHQNKITSSPLIVLWLHSHFMPRLDTGANIQWQ
jgi:hypothetical protein